MHSSKIDQLRQSTLNFPRNSLRGSKNNYQQVDMSLLGDYQLKMPICPYHHKPIRYLCLRKQCKSSSFGLCGSDECRKMHADPDVDLIELGKFNELVRDDCISIQMLLARMKKYYKTVRQQLIHKIDLSIEKSLYLFENNHTPQVLKLIKNKKHSQLDSAKLSIFIQRELNQNTNLRVKMQAIRNKISDRLKIKDNTIEKIIKTHQFEQSMLSDLLISEDTRGGELNSRVQVKQIGSNIVSGSQQIQILSKLLRQNRASSFNKVNLIFRGSQHNFQSQTMHQAIISISPLLLLVKTSLGRKFGAYINCKINTRQQWISDVSGLSFLFSIDRQQGYRLKAQASSRLKAAFGGSKGIQLGSGCDLYISQHCHLNKKNGANLGGSYRLPSHLQFNSLQSRSYLAGEQYFQVDQCEFFSFE